MYLIRTTQGDQQWLGHIFRSGIVIKVIVTLVIGFATSDVSHATASEDLNELARLLDHSDDERRLEAIRGLRKHGMEAIPFLLRAFQDREERIGVEASRAVSALGVPAVPELIELLNNPNLDFQRMENPSGDDIVRVDQARETAWLTLVEIGDCVWNRESCNAVTSALEQALTVRRWGIRGEVFLALNALQYPMDKTIPMLVEAVSGESKYAALRAIKFLAQLAPAAQSAIPSLKLALKDNHYFVRVAAADALRLIDPGVEHRPPSELERIWLSLSIGWSADADLDDWAEKLFQEGNLSMPHVFVDGEFVGLLPGEFLIDLWENNTVIEIGVPEIIDRPMYVITLRKPIVRTDGGSSGKIMIRSLRPAREEIESGAGVPSQYRYYLEEDPDGGYLIYPKKLGDGRYSIELVTGPFASFIIYLVSYYEDGREAPPISIVPNAQKYALGEIVYSGWAVTRWLQKHLGFNQNREEWLVSSKPEGALVVMVGRSKGIKTNTKVSFKRDMMGTLVFMLSGFPDCLVRDMTRTERSGSKEIHCDFHDLRSRQAAIP